MATAWLVAAWQIELAPGHFHSNCKSNSKRQFPFMSPPFVAASFAPLLKYLPAYAFLPLKLLFMTFIFIDCTTECRRQSRVKWKMSKRQEESVRESERESERENTATKQPWNVLSNSALNCLCSFWGACLLCLPHKQLARDLMSLFQLCFHCAFLSLCSGKCAWGLTIVII